MTEREWPESWAPYMTWAKHHPPAKYDLCGSNLLPLSLDELKGARESLEISGQNDDGYQPLVDAIAHPLNVGRFQATAAPDDFRAADRGKGTVNSGYRLDAA